MNLLVLGFDLLRPGWTLALAAGPLLLCAALWALARRRRERAALVAPRHLARLVPDWSAGRARWRGLLAALAAAFLGLAAVGPVRGYTVRDVERRGLDIVVALDTSRSMLAQDVRPDRLTRAQREVRGLLQKLGGDRAALLGFAGDVRLVAPLTGDRQTLGALVETLSPRDNQQGGTNLGGAIERALALFDGRTGAHEAIVLLTDGEDLDGQGLSAAALAAERGIRIFVVGVGTEGGGKIPDRHLGFVRDAAGQEVISRLDSSTLRLIAERSGGAYLAVGEAPFPLERLYAEHMGRLEGRELWAGKMRIPHDRFQWPLALALVCMASAAGLRERVPGESRRAGRAAPATRGAAHAGWLGCLALLAPLVAAGGEGFAARMGEVRRLARAGELEPALERCGELLSANEFTRWRAELEPEGFALRAVELAEPLWDFLRWNGWPAEARAEVHFARGVLLLEHERRAEAEEAFQNARGLWPHGTLVLEATYDLGLAALLEGEAWRARIPELGGQPPAAAGPDEEPPDPLEQARAHYLRARAALVERLRLDWRDADTRANVELVQRRLRELDELERQREEQQQEQQPSDSDSEEGEGEPQEGTGEDSGEGEPQQDPGEEPTGEDPSEGEPSEPSDPGEEPGPDEGPEPPAEEQPAEGAEDESETQPTPEPEEALLSREQIQRLLDRLQQLEEQAEALREARRSRQRMPVERDW